MSKREEQRAFRREQILSCCMDRILTHGYAGMKLRDIAAELSISPGLIFNYFESKEEIYLELVRLGISGPMELIGQAVGAETGAPIRVFEHMAEAIFRYIQESGFVAKMFLLMSRTQNSMDVPPSVKAALSGMDAIGPLLSVIREGQKEGSIRQGNPEALLWAYWGAIQGIAACCALNPALPMPESGWIVDILRADTGR
ncbi:MAG TPA: TetR/AcrR family transcriptional regulator [Feifaniaceae bacterium]|nr:TetR/AcrR family transcriptional regulator [Feifaniaceae bacterium]